MPNLVDSYSSALLYFFFLFAFFFFNDTATTEIYTLSLHDALPIADWGGRFLNGHFLAGPRNQRSEEHTSELQSRLHLVCRLLLEKKKKKILKILFKKKKRKRIQQRKAM